MNIQEESVSVQFGKKGLSQEFISEIEKALKTKKLVKVKLLKNALQNTDRKKISEQITELLAQKNKFEQKLVGNVLFLKKITA